MYLQKGKKDGAKLVHLFYSVFFLWSGLVVHVQAAWMAVPSNLPK